MTALPKLRQYETDKLHTCLPVYEPLFRPLADQQIKLLELGIHRGGSLRLWRDYFPGGTIVGLDANPVSMDDAGGRIHIYQGLQQDTALLSRIAAERAPEGFDIIIDDASHLAELTRTSFWHLFEHHLKPGGLYAIEDWGTGYFDNWPDGRRYRACRWRKRLLRALHRCGILPRLALRSHCHGMVGFIKELIDEQGAAELSSGALGQPALREPRFKSILVTRHVVVVTKAA